MLQTKLQAPEQSSPGEEDFKYISFFNTRFPAEGPFWTPGSPFEQIRYRSTRQCYIPNIKALALEVSEKMSFEAVVDGRRTLGDGNSSP